MADALPIRVERHVLRRLLRAALLASAAALPALAPAYGDDAPPLIRNNAGSVGLIDMPSARMAPDGMASVNATFYQNTQRYNLGYQILPWLETSFRYSGISDFFPGSPVYFDRSFGMKVRLWEDNGIFPAVAIGANDIVGTGIYTGEYIVATKQFGDVGATLGMGWGRLSTANSIRNPLRLLSGSFANRAGYNGSSFGGNFNFSTYFHGPNAGVFGGLDWRTPIDGLTLIAEYSSDAYLQERAAGAFVPRTQVNLGASYELSDSVILGLNWFYGRSIGGNVTFQLDPTKIAYPQKVGAAPMPEPRIRTAKEQQRALQALLQARSGGPVPASDTNEMVDLLWRQKGISNIEIKGRTLLLTVSDSTPADRCLDATRILQSYDSNITTVQLNAGPDRAVLRCATPSAPNQDFQNGIFVGDAATRATPAKIQPAVLTIDASARHPEKNFAAAIKAEALAQSVIVLAATVNGGEAIIYYSNQHYFSEADAITRLTVALMKLAPPEVERFRLIAIKFGVPQREFEILRAPMERQYNINGTVEVFAPTNGTTSGGAPMNNPVLDDDTRHNYPSFYWNVFPQFRQQFFDPQNPLGLQLVAAAEASVEIKRGFSINSEFETSLYDDFTTNRDGGSTLPHVRTDFLKYFTEGKTGMGLFDSEYRFRLSPNVFGLVKAGYLESMFAGVGGEVLWRPENARWALGVDAYEVKQREFDRLFGLQHYHVFTGHVSLYYSSPWYGLNIAVRAGQYLAGDRGLTLELTRRFASGVEIGAFATKTNVSSAAFGEGSFDKGIIIRIPLGWALPIETQTQYGVDLRPIQRDGGQRLLGDASLFEETRRASEDEIRRLNVQAGP